MLVGGQVNSVRINKTTGSYNLFNPSQAKGLAKSGLKNLLMHKVGQRLCGYMLPLNQILLWFYCTVILLSCVCVCNAGPQWRTQPSERRISVTPACPIRLLAEPPANYTTLWEGEICLKTIAYLFQIFMKLEQTQSTSLSLPNPPILLSYTASLCCFAPFTPQFLSLYCDSPRHLSPLLGECCVAVPLLCYSMLPNVSHVPVGLFTNLGLPEMRRTWRTRETHGMGESQRETERWRIVENPGKR